MTRTLADLPRFQQVLVPFDMSKHAEQALAEAVDLVAPGGHLHLVHVLERVDLSTPMLVWPTPEDEPRRRHARRLLADIQPPGATSHVLIGDPATQILRYADEAFPDLIVMSTHGRTGLKHLLLGSVAEKVIRLASCPVLVVKPTAMGSLD